MCLFFLDNSLFWIFIWLKVHPSLFNPERSNVFDISSTLNFACVFIIYQVWLLKSYVEIDFYLTNLWTSWVFPIILNGLVAFQRMQINCVVRQDFCGYGSNDLKQSWLRKEIETRENWALPVKVRLIGSTRWNFPYNFCSVSWEQDSFLVG